MTFSILKLCWFVFRSSFSYNVPIISSPLRSYKILMTIEILLIYLYGTVFLTSLITKTSSYQFGVYPLAKMFLYFDVLTWSSTLNLGSLSLNSLIESICIIFNFNRLYFNCSIICIFVFIYNVIQFINITIVYTAVICR